MFSNCDSARQTQYNNPDGPFEIVFESDYGGKEEKNYTIIKNKADLKNELARLHLEESTINRLNTVDFDKQLILSLHMGTRNTGGYSIKVSNVEINGNITYVTITENTPKPEEMVTMALTQPFCIVLIDVNENIVFN